MTQNPVQLQALADEETTLRFRSFTARDALQIGQILIRQAQADDTPILIRIEAFGLVLFQYAFDGITPDNVRWMRRKVNVTQLFRHSSFYMQRLVEESGRSMQEALSLSPSDYDASGGCFPILLLEGGMIGHVSVSGYSPAGDHRAIVSALQSYLQGGDEHLGSENP